MRSCSGVHNGRLSILEVPDLVSSLQGFDIKTTHHVLQKWAQGSDVHKSIFIGLLSESVQ